MKTAIIIVHALWLAYTSAFHAHNVARKSPAEAIPILLYHSVADNPQDPLSVLPARFERQLAHLRDRGYHPLFFADLAAWGQRPLPPKPVIITMDDGYDNQFTAAYPILRRTGMKATIFAITGRMGKPGYLTWQQLRMMEASGTVDTQSHTVTHPDFTKISPAQKRAELVESRDAIFRQLGHRSYAFAYPYGKYDQDSVVAVRLAGYRYAVTGEPGYAERSQGLLKLHRIIMTGAMPLEDFYALLP
ncbi:polysaccharide deacetylase family protein [Cohnella pontilimi]|nr:polysaccharide deacetylase family protein [Cohnella pontilimi]